jgi:hypothetical protein
MRLHSLRGFSSSSVGQAAGLEESWTLVLLTNKELGEGQQMLRLLLLAKVHAASSCKRTNYAKAAPGRGGDRRIGGG